MIRRTASEVLRSLEMRVARLERNASRFSKRANTKPFALVEGGKTNFGWGLSVVVSKSEKQTLAKAFRSSNSPAVEEALKTKSDLKHLEHDEWEAGHGEESGKLYYGISVTLLESDDEKGIHKLLAQLDHKFTLIENDGQMYPTDSPAADTPAIITLANTNDLIKSKMMRGVLESPSPRDEWWFQQVLEDNYRTER